MVEIDKKALLEALRERLESELLRARARATDAAEGATHEENRAEGDKDMRATEASYIARGHAGRTAELETALSRLAVLSLRSFDRQDAIESSALVELEYGGRRLHYFLVPAAGGEKLLGSGVNVQTLTPQSPLGAALIGRAQGEEIEVNSPQGARSYEIVSVK